VKYGLRRGGPSNLSFLPASLDGSLGAVESPVPVLVLGKVEYVFVATDLSMVSSIFVARHLEPKYMMF